MKRLCQSREDRLKKKKEYREKNKDRIDEYNKQYRQKNKDKINKQRKKYREVNKEQLSLDYTKWYAKNKDSKYQIDRRKKYYKINKELLNKKKKYWYVKNKEHLKKYRINRRKINAKQEMDRYNSNSQYCIRNLLRNRLFYAMRNFSINGKIKSSGKYGINYNAICKRLGPKPNDIEIWHIDHIKPLCSFDFNDEEQIKIAFAPENHQWLTAKQNLSKGSKIL